MRDDEVDLSGDYLGGPKPHPTDCRDRVQQLAKTDSAAALALARSIELPWYKAQALSWIARYSETETRAVAEEAAATASRGDDAYQRVAVRAWKIAALAERELEMEARLSLNSALAEAPMVEPSGSRAEAFILLLQAALRIGVEEGNQVCAELVRNCGENTHWRCKRALKNAKKLSSGETRPRRFFW